MFQVIFPIPLGTEKEKIEAIFYPSWQVYKSDKDVYSIYHIVDELIIGSMKILPLKVVIRVDENKPHGKNFWLDFAKLYPELDPFEIHYGVVRPIDRVNEIYELDDIPKSLLAESLDKVAGGEDTDAFFVKYHLGDWHPREELKVISHAQIFGRGRVGYKMGEWTFKLCS